ncbi:sensor histidine kinase [Novosphingobium sp. G106]|uniref:sensor histidine kinase n=1 Tax=Novosphingobium sp. G106 TaxID=2849500 RepID=UPI001C2D9EE7|nr:sensor histidine kinase [Novosphingobium sp. G106]MBV1691539.1 sensor histidine kinase [Novosphingobium sp. G106]
MVDFPMKGSIELPAERLEVLRELIHGIPLPMFVVGGEGRILISNLAGEQGGRLRAEFSAIAIGSPFEDVLRQLPLDEEAFDRVREQVGRIAVGAASLAQDTYELLTAEPQILSVRAMRLPYPGNLSLIVLAGARSAVKDRLSRRRKQIQILRAQDEERRRIARDLHDDTSQQLALIQVKLECLRKAQTSDQIADACIEIESALQSAHHQMRTLSYVLHPPELTSGGIAEALSTFLKGFARRTQLVVTFESSAGRLKAHADLEIALYRVVQEALMNVSKHAEATVVNVSLKMQAKHLVLEIKDNGIGIPSEILTGRMPEAVGVGLTSMRERVESLAGHFRVERGVTGTQVRASFPVRRSTDVVIAPSGLHDIVPNGI